MATLSDLIVRLQQVGEEMRSVASDAREAAEEVEYLGRVEAETVRTSSAVAKAKGSGESTLGSSSGSSQGGAGVPKAVTAAGLNAELKAMRGRVG